MLNHDQEQSKWLPRHLSFRHLIVLAFDFWNLIISAFDFWHLLVWAFYFRHLIVSTSEFSTFSYCPQWMLTNLFWHYVPVAEVTAYVLEDPGSIPMWDQNFLPYPGWMQQDNFISSSEQRPITMSWLIHSMTCRLTWDILEKVWWSGYNTINKNCLQQIPKLW